MTPKELLFTALRHETTPRAPWVPFAGVHAGALLGANATQVLTDEDTLFKALMEVNRLYRPDGQPVVFDLQLEAEILGCDLAWADDGSSQRCQPSSGRHHDRSLQMQAPQARPGTFAAGAFGYAPHERGCGRNHCSLWTDLRSLHAGFSSAWQ